MKGRAREDSSSRSTRTPSSSSFARSIRCNNPRQKIKRSKERSHLVSVLKRLYRITLISWNRVASLAEHPAPCLATKQNFPKPFHGWSCQRNEQQCGGNFA